MPEQDREVDLERLVAFYEPLSHEELARSIRGRRFADPKWLFMDVKQPDPWQGDVVPDAELHLTMADGGAFRLTGPAMLLSHGCDAVPEQDPLALMAPVFEVSDFEAEYRQRVDALRANRLSGMFFLPAVGVLPDRYVDFNHACAVSTTRIAQLFADAPLAQRTRLSMRGWWLFTAKLAHHMARQENPVDYPRSYL